MVSNKANEALVDAHLTWHLRNWPFSRFWKNPSTSQCVQKLWIDSPNCEWGETSLVQYEFWETGGLHLIRAAKPFELDQLYQEGLEAVKSGGKRAELWRPTIFDYRQVNLLQFEAQGFRRLIEKRKALGEEHNNNPAAYLVGDLGSFGMARMNNIYAEIAGLRNEDQTIVALEVSEIVEWLAPRLGIDDIQAAELSKLIS